MELRQVEVLIAPARNIFDGKETIPKPAQFAMGVFHCWEHHKDGEDFSKVYGLVELEGGKVGRYEVENIRFTGKPVGANLFEEGLPID